jgi:hypothetical protein
MTSPPPTLAPYWTLLQLRANGTTKAKVLPIAQTTLQDLLQQTGGKIPEVHSRIFQGQLLRESQSPLAAQLCLRCYISHQILNICHQLAEQFGFSHGFTSQDLLSIVLDDDGQAISGPYRPRSQRILERFDPDIASLSTWSHRLIRCDDELNQFLKQQGLWLISDWAILNNRNSKTLHRTIATSTRLSRHQIEQAPALLESYQAVYRRDRLLHRQRGPCAPPTPEQLNEMGRCLQAQGQPPLTAKALLAELLVLAQELRLDRLSRHDGLRQAVSLEDLTGVEPVDERSLPVEPSPWQTLTTFYQQQLSDCLSQAIAAVLAQRIEPLAPTKQQQFLTALRSLYREGLKMGDIASRIGFTAQYQVSRLLNLKALRADIRQRTIACLLVQMREKVTTLVSPEQLQQLDQRLEELLSEQIDALITAEQESTQTPGQYVQEKSRLALEIGRILQENYPE